MIRGHKNINTLDKPIDCIHTSFTYSSTDKIICAGCGDLITMVIDNDEEVPTYFEILHLEDDGTYTAFHRSYKAQIKLLQYSDDLH